MNVVGNDNFDVEFSGKLHKLRHYCVFFRNAVLLNFNVVVVAEQRLVLQGKFPCLLRSVGKEKTGQLSAMHAERQISPSEYFCKVSKSILGL